ncbi:MAG: ABC transporter ATP-binding protein [Gammaproteobacteria bacterium]|nr:MAG: ABC transporter ATP-binding protein [Gammaproteobacteria bacterium]
MTTIISIENLNKAYKKQPVLTDLNWQIEQGDVIGLLGKNGAGKSTLLKSLLNINEIDSGKVTVFSENHNDLSATTKAKIGYVPQENDEISWLSVDDLIKFRKQFYSHWNDEKVTNLISSWDIDTSKKIAELSPGQVQKILIILALAPEPELLIFDEPAAALDPSARREFLKEIVNLTAQENITIVFSTHIVSDLERVANKVAILDQGKICYFDELDNLKENVVQLTLSFDQQAQQELNVPFVLSQKNTPQGLSCVVSQLDTTWLELIKNKGVSVDIIPMGLEDIFLELTS